MTTQEKMYYIDNMNTERDIRNQIQFAVDKGREEEKKLMATKLTADGMDIELIIKYSGLTREEVEKL